MWILKCVIHCRTELEHQHASHIILKLELVIERHCVSIFFVLVSVMYICYLADIREVLFDVSAARACRANSNVGSSFTSDTRKGFVLFGEGLK